MKIIRGNFSGRSILSPNSKLTRPTTDKVRQAVFNVLEHNVNMPSLEGAVVLDAFAGTGALGLEALSRGADSVTFVEKQRQSTLNISRLVHDWNIKSKAHILNQDFFSYTDPAKPYDIVFCDPPYGKKLVGASIKHLIQYQMLSTNALVVAEMHKRDSVDCLSSLKLLNEKKYGDIKVIFLTLHQ